MTRPPSALVAIGGFGVFVAALSVAATAAVVVFAPQPPPTRVRPATALAALRGETDGFVRSYTDSPPTGPRATIVERLLADALGRPHGDVRAVWQERALARVTSRVAPPSAVTVGRASRRPIANGSCDRSNAAKHRATGPPAASASAW